MMPFTLLPFTQYRMHLLSATYPPQDDGFGGVHRAPHTADQAALNFIQEDLH